MRVLIVDDDADCMEVLGLSLIASHGWEVLEVGTGAQALEICRTCELDAVLLDVAMPVMDGPGVLVALRADPRTAHLPVIFVTASEPAIYVGLCALGAAGVLPKPFDPLLIGDQLAGFLGW